MRSALEASFWERLVGVVTLQRPIYEALQRDPAATGQSWLIVILLGLGNGISVIVVGTAALPPDVARVAPDLAAALTFESDQQRVIALACGIAGAVISWYVSAWLLRLIGNRLAQTRRAVTAEEMRRLVAWGYSPSLASFLTTIPLIGPLLAFAGSLWAFVTGVMAVRTAFGVGVWRAIVIEIVAFVLVLLVVTVVVLVTVMVAWSTT